MCYVTDPDSFSSCDITDFSDPVCVRLNVESMNEHLTYYHDRSVLATLVQGADIGAHQASVHIRQTFTSNHGTADQAADEIAQTIEADLKGFGDGHPFVRVFDMDTEAPPGTDVKTHKMAATDKKSLAKLARAVDRSEAQALLGEDMVDDEAKRRLDDMKFGFAPVNEAIPVALMMVLSLSSVMMVAKLVHKLRKKYPTAILTAGKVDLRHGYKHIRVMPKYIRYMVFFWAGLFYAHLCLPFGLRPACHIFARFTNAITWVLNKLSRVPINNRTDFRRALRALQVRGKISNRSQQRYYVFSFVDDFLILAISPALYEEGRRVFLWLGEEWGFVVNKKKLAIEGSGGPRCIWLGLQFRLRTGVLAFDSVRRKYLLLYVTRILTAVQTSDSAVLNELLGTRRLWNRLIGFLLNASITTTMGRLYVNALLGCLRKGQLIPDADATAELIMWADILREGSGVAFERLCRPIWLQSADRCFPLFSDAARNPDDPTAGFGAFLVVECFVFYIHGTWNDIEKFFHINELETVGVAIASELFGRAVPAVRAVALQPITVSSEAARAIAPPLFKVHADNATTVTVFSDQKTVSADVARVARVAHKQLCIQGTAVWASHIAGVKNVGADHLSRGRIQEFLAWCNANLPSFTPIQLHIPLWTRRRYSARAWP